VNEHAAKETQGSVAEEIEMYHRLDAAPRFLFCLFAINSRQLQHKGECLMRTNEAIDKANWRAIVSQGAAVLVY
jgi:hypothetical protein